MWLVKIILDSWFSALDPTINGVSTFGSPSLNRCLCHKHMQGVKKQLSYTSTRTCLLGQPRSRGGYSLGELHVPHFSKARAPNALRIRSRENQIRDQESFGPDLWQGYVFFWSNLQRGHDFSGPSWEGVNSFLDQICDRVMTFFDGQINNSPDPVSW